VAYDHGSSEVKLSLALNDEDNFIILTLTNSIEFEGELKLRFGVYATAHRDFRMPSAVYVGMFAGATKPKPFQRKRPNLSVLPAGKLPTLQVMRNMALELQRGSYRPCPPGESRRVDLAMRHIYEGKNSFPLLGVRGLSGVSSQWRHESLLVIADESLIFKPLGPSSNQSIEFSFEDIADWNALDNDHRNPGDSGLEIISNNGDRVLFAVQYIRDVKHTLEYFWNQYQVANGKDVKLGSTHGRPLVSVTTLSGESPAPEKIAGNIEVVDQDGIVVRAGARMARRSSGLASSMLASKEPMTVPPENRLVKPHWHKVVVHQGWLLKKGGVGIGAAKSWIKRYFVLYKTSQGHFLIYYGDFTECPMYTNEKNYRNIVDLAKTTFIRPGSNKAEFADTPAHSFDIVTTEREWTLCAESQENAQKWLKLLNRAVDEDVAILPDEDLVFKVKPKVDPLGTLPALDYSTSLKVSANGVSVTAPDPNTGNDREQFFWVYTDFYKWSLLSQVGKLALLVNVFADATFNRRNEYVFRTKEAVRLATAIEYFIEKFMSVMHVRLELMEDISELRAQATNGKDTKSTQEYGTMHNNADEFVGGFEDVYKSDELDLLDLDSAETYAPPPQATYKPASSIVDPFGDDPFGNSPTTSTNSPPPIPPKPAVDIFGDDPFGGDPFGGSPAPVITHSAPKIAPPLSAAQINQHKLWLTAALASGGGPVYDDGSLQLSAKIDVRGSQARLMLLYRNQSSANLSHLQVEIIDGAAFLRFEASPVQDAIAGLAQFQQQVMMELMKPAAGALTIKISYEDSALGSRSNTIQLPVVVTSFNEPLPLSGADFAARWNQLVVSDLENQEIIRPASAIVPAHIHLALTNVSSSLLLSSHLLTDRHKPAL
jgi:hypothetical protein